VLRSVADAARGLGVDRVRIWLLKDDDNALMLSFDTAAGPQGPADATRVLVGTGLVGRTAKYGRPIGPEPLEDGAGHAVAVPLIVGGRVVGALECLVLQAMELGHEVLEILEALAGHAAGALASAQLHEQTAELAVTDPLTGLSNRRAFEADFPNEVDRAQRYQRPLSLISLDLDNFKLLNDRYGHAYGDLVLQQTSQALIDVVRGSDRVYRVGGEEITVLCPETDAQHATALAERLRAAVEAAGGPDAPVFTASLGVAELPRHASGAADLLVAADRALYAAKNDGRNRVASAEPKIPSPSRSVAGS
jgi:diguanylate cyclase (GGDEF)-like protein